MGDLLEQAQAFFKSYAELFTIETISDFSNFFTEPYVSLRSDGRIQSMPTNRSAIEFFKSVLANNLQEGCCSLLTKDYEVNPIGKKGMLVTLTWEMLDSSGCVIREWRQSYTLVKRDEKWYALAAIHH